MNILLIHQAFVPPNQSGGTRHYEFAQHLTRQGSQFSIVTSNENYLSGKSNQSNPTDEDGIHILYAKAHSLRHKSFFWRIIGFVNFMVTSVWTALQVRSVEVVMGTSPPIFQAVSAWFVALVKRVPFILEVRDLWPEFAIDMGVLTNPVLIKLSRILESFLYRRATHLIVNSPAYRDYLIDKGISASDITLIPNGVDPEMFDSHQDGTAIRHELGLKGKFVATYAGALGMANDIPNILQAAKLLEEQTDIHLLLVGDGKERCKLEQMAAELGLNNVTFTGARPKSEMPAFLAASDVCLATLLNIPMFNTTYPNKVFDYMAAERPTILAIDGVIREVVEAGEGGVFVAPGDSNALAEAIIRLASDRKMSNRMGKSARDYVIKHFNRSEQAQLFAETVAQFEKV